MLTSQAIAEFLASRGGLRPRTVGEYRNHLALFQQAFPDLPETPHPIQAWINNLKRQRGTEELAAETIHARFTTIRSFYKEIHLRYPKIRNPMPLVRAPRMPKKAMRTFSEGELYRLFSLPLRPRERALLTLLLDVGPRAGECARLTWEDVMPGFAVLSGKVGTRIVPISESTYRLLLALRNGDGTAEHVFLGERGPLTYQGIYKLVRHLCQQAGILGGRCSPHSWRHTFATIYAAAESCDPKVLQDIMGHEDFKTTLKYIHNNPLRMARNHLRCTPLRVLGGGVQGSLFSDSDSSQALKEAERILDKKE